MNVNIPIDPVWMDNTVRNLPLLTSNPNIVCLKNLFRGIPCLVVGPGPSLEALLPQIKDVADKVVIVACGTALKPLVLAGVHPHLVVALDASQLTAPQVMNIDKGQSFLACNAASNNILTSQYKNRLFWYSIGNPFIEWFEPIKEKEGLCACGTVAVTAAHLSLYMGCNPVILAGLDFAYRNDLSIYAKGSIKEGHRADPNKEAIALVPASVGEGRVSSPVGFGEYRDGMASLIACFTESVFHNVSASGAAIPGAPYSATILKEIEASTCVPFDVVRQLECVHKKGARPDPVLCKAQVEQGIAELCEAEVLLKEAFHITTDIIHGHSERDLSRLEAIDKTLLTMSKLVYAVIKPSLINRAVPIQDKANQYATVINKRSRLMYENMLGLVIYYKALLEKQMP